jgi:DNA replication protein DnaC
MTMLTHPTLDLLHNLGLHGMAKGFKSLEQAAETRGLEHAEWLGLLLEHELTLRRQKRFEARARTARLRHNASVEDIDYRAARGLDRTLFLKLAACDFIRERRNLLMTGPCGVGKSWLACALGHKACREDLSVLYHRMPRLFAALALARGDGRYAKLLRALARVDLLILDDWGPEQLNAEQRRDLLEIVEDRYDSRSILITSQLPVDRWYEIIGDPTLADAILDRIIHNAYRIELTGDSMRKLKAAAHAEPEARSTAQDVPTSVSVPTSKSAKAHRK